MIFATIEFTRAARTMFAHLTDTGWTVPELPAVGDTLTALFSLSEYGPADGDPVRRAAGEAAGLLDGRVTFIRDLEASPPESVY